MAFQLLSVPNFVLPATYAGWLAVDEEQLAAIKEVWTADLLIDVHDSQLFTACPGAFTASYVNGRAVAPLHEVEYLLARFLRASDAIRDMKIGELGISPLKLSAVEAHLVNPGAGAAAFDFSPCTATVLLRRLALFSAAHARPPAFTVVVDDLIACEAVPDDAGIAANWPSMMALRTLVDEAGGLSPFADFCSLVGSRAYHAERGLPNGRFFAMSTALRSTASSLYPVADVLAGDVVGSFMKSTEWPSLLVRHVRSLGDAVADVQARGAFASNEPAHMGRAIAQRIDYIIDAFPRIHSVVDTSHGVECVEYVRQLLQRSLDSTNLSLTSLAALEASLPNSDALDGDTPHERVQNLVLRKRHRDEQRESMSSSSGASSYGSRDVSYFSRANISELEALLDSPLFTAPMAYAPQSLAEQAANADRVPVESTSGLTALFCHAKYQSPLERLRLAFNRRELMLHQAIFNGTTYRHDTLDMLVMARPYLGQYLSLVVATNEFGKQQQPSDRNWRIGQNRTVNGRLQPDTTKSIIEHLRAGEFHLIDYHNDLFVSLHESRGSAIAPPRIDSSKQSPWLQKRALETITLVDRLYGGIGFPHMSEDSFYALAQKAHIFNLAAPENFSHADTCEQACNALLLDAGHGFSSYLKSPPGTAFPSFCPSDSRAMAALDDAQEARDDLGKLARAYPEIVQAASAAARASTAAPADPPRKKAKGREASAEAAEGREAAAQRTESCESSRPGHHGPHRQRPNVDGRDVHVPLRAAARLERGSARRRLPVTRHVPVSRHRSVDRLRARAHHGGHHGPKHAAMAAPELACVVSVLGHGGP